MGVSVKEPHLELVLQGGNVLTDGRLGDGMGGRRLGKAQTLGQGDEIFNLFVQNSGVPSEGRKDSDSYYDCALLS